MERSKFKRRICPTHKRPLVRHAVVVNGAVVGHCWDCPAKLTPKQWAEQYARHNSTRVGGVYKAAGLPHHRIPQHATCFYHEHEGEY